MNPTPPPAGDPLLERLLTGEVGLDAPEVQERMLRDPEFREEALTLLDLVNELGPPMPSVRQEPEPWAGADAAVRDLVAQLQPEGATRPGRPRRTIWPWLLAAAAAALLLILFVPRGDRLPEANGPTLLATGGMFPSGDVARSELLSKDFDWTPKARGASGQFRLDFFDASGKPLPDQPPIDLGATRYRLSEDRVARLPERFRWQVKQAGGGGPTRTFSADVRLLP